MPLSARTVRPTSIYGSFEPEQEQDNEAKPNLETMVLTGCHELGPESLLSIGNLVGAQIRSIDLSLCPITDSTIGDFSKLCPNVKHLAIRYSLFILFFYFLSFFFFFSVLLFLMCRIFRGMAVGEQIRLALQEQWKSLTSLDLEDCTFSIDQQQLEEVF